MNSKEEQIQQKTQKQETACNVFFVFTGKAKVATTVLHHYIL